MKEKFIEFEVLGTKGEVHNVSFAYMGIDDMHIHCSCSAREYCHHIIDILRGDASKIVSRNTEDLEFINKWVIKSGTTKSIERLDQIEKDLKELKNEKKRILRNIYHL